jgi:hypothetical protein
MTTDKETGTGVTEEHEQEFLASLARAVLSWQFVERNLFLIFSSMIRGRDHDLVSAAFYSVINLRAKLEMVDAVAQLALLGTELLAEWDSLRKCISKRSQHRNHLVHSPLLGHFETDETVTLRLARPIFDVRLKEHQERTLADIKQFVGLFDDLAQRLDRFGKQVVAKLPR